MKKYKLTILFIFCAVVTILLLNKSINYEIAKKVNMFSAGSYAFAEQYSFPLSEKKIINTLIEFKKNNPELSADSVTLFHKKFALKDTIVNKHWFITHLYDPKKNKLFKIAIRGSETNTDLILVAINKSLEIGNWKDINKDLSYKENEDNKNEFEQLFLEPIKSILAKK